MAMTARGTKRTATPSVAYDAQLADDRDTAVGRRFGVQASTIHGDRCGSTLRLGRRS